jgi:hypothetical protein
MSDGYPIPLRVDERVRNVLILHVIQREESF